MKNKLKLVLWGKKLQLPENYDNLKFDDYEFDDCLPYFHRLILKLHNKYIMEIFYNVDYGYYYHIIYYDINEKWFRQKFLTYDHGKLIYKQISDKNHKIIEQKYY